MINPAVLELEHEHWVDPVTFTARWEPDRVTDMSFKAIGIRKLLTVNMWMPFSVDSSAFEGNAP